MATAMRDRIRFQLPVMAFLTATLCAQDPQVIRSRVDAVRVDVTVTNRDGIFESGLTREDFEILDNGRPQPLTGFSSDPSPLTVAFVLDMSDSMMRQTRRMAAAAYAFLDALKPGDRAAVGSLMTPGPLRSDANALRQDLSQLTLGEGSAIWRSIKWASVAVAEADGRQAILLSTDGKDVEDEIRRLAPRVTRTQIAGDVGLTRLWPLIEPQLSSSRSASGHLEARAVQLYVIALQGARVPKQLLQVVEDSGGRVLPVKREDNLATVFGGIAGELRQQYLLSYAPPESDGQVHEIKVRVKRPGLNVRTRRSYLAAAK